MITPPSDIYLSVLRDAHESRVRLLLYREYGATPPWGRELIGELPVVSLRLNYDGKANVQRTADIEYGIDPWGTESRETIEGISTEAGIITIEHGVSYPGETDIAWVLLGTLRVDSISYDLQDAARMVNAYDRSILVQEHLLETVRPLDDTYVNLIETMLQETIPGEALTIGPGFTPEDLALSPSSGKALAENSPRLVEMQRLAEVISANVANTPDGGFILRKSIPGGESVWTIDAGHGGVLVSALQETSRREQYNAVSIRWTPDGSQPDDEWMVRIFLWDNDPTSPTYYDGPFGKRPIFFEEEYDHIPSQDEAESIARAKLAQYTGATRSLDISAVYNPLLEPGDTVTIVFLDGDSENHVIDSVSIQLAPAATMDVTTRLVRPTSYGVEIDGSAA